MDFEEAGVITYEAILKAISRMEDTYEYIPNSGEFFTLVDGKVCIVSSTPVKEPKVFFNYITQKFEPIKR